MVKNYLLNKQNDPNHITLHALISLSCPIFFICSIYFLLTNSFPQFFSLNPFIFLFIFFINLTEIVICNILYRERTGSASHIRSSILIIGFVYVIFALLKKGPLQKRFFPSFSLIYPFLLTIIPWLLTYAIYKGFKGRELVLKLIQNKEGDELKQIIRNNHVQNIETFKDLKKLKILLNLCIIIIFICLIFYWLSDIHLSPAAVFFISLFLFVTYLCLSGINIFLEDQRYNGQGMKISPFYQKKRLWYIIILLAICLILALNFSNTDSIFPFEWLTRSGNWLLSLIPKNEIRISVRRPKLIRDSFGNIANRLSEQTKNIKPVLGLNTFFKYFTKIFYITLIALLIIFILSPLINVLFMRRLKESNPVRTFFQFLSSFWIMIYRFFLTIIQFIIIKNKKDKIIDPQKTIINKQAFRQLDKEHRQKKMQELSILTNAFIKLIKWGKKKKVKYQPQRLPQEYISAIIARYPMKENDLITILNIFEEAHFSLHLVGDEIIETYLGLIKSMYTLKD